MTPERHERIGEHFLAARNLPVDQREAYLAAACADDPLLGTEVRSLLVADAQGTLGALRPAFDSDDLPSPAERGRGLVGKRIDRYTILRVIATGGMGTVYEATQENPQRAVAVKVMKQGIASRSALRRFEYETQILARLRHPGIAQIFEAGTYVSEPRASARADPQVEIDSVGGDETQAVPYFAMEYIPNAKSLTEFAEEKELGTRERMELFAKVCEAVHHGHQKGIIHRDLKPSNILVDSAGQAKVIDFGVARSTDCDLALTTLQTAVGQLIGTLQYMSPEQCAADPHDIDIRTDVYALGVVFYELLCGKLPYDLSQAAIHQATRIIREQHPTPLSTVNRTLRGDVETIALKALEKERERRYQSAAEFGEDIHRYLRSEPIQARPPSVMYQMRAFARRNKGVVASLTAVFAVLVTGAIVSTTLYFRAERARVEQSLERERAEDALVDTEAARNEAESVTTFISDMLAATHPEMQGKDVTVRQVLDAAARAMGERFPDEPLIRARLGRTIGLTYLGLGLLEQAESSLADAAAVYARVRGARDPVTLSVTTTLAMVISNRGGYTESEAALRSTLEVQRRVLGEEHGDTLTSMNDLAITMNRQGRYAEAEEVQRKALKISSRVLGQEHRITLVIIINLAISLMDQGRYDEADEFQRKALEICRRVYGEEHPQTLRAMNNLGRLLAAQGRHAEAQELYRQALDVRRRLLGEDHPETLGAMHNVAVALNEQGRHVEATELYRTVLAAQRRVLGEEHPQTVRSVYNLSVALSDQGSYDEAQELARKALAYYRRALGEEHPETLAAMTNLAIAVCSQGHYAEAEAMNRIALAISRSVLGEEHPQTLAAANSLANTIIFQDRFAEAEEIYRQNLEIARRVLGDVHPNVAVALESLASVLLEMQQFKEADALTRQAASIWGLRLPPGHRSRLLNDNLSGAVLVGLGRFSEAESLLINSFEGLSDDGGIPVQVRKTLLERLSRLYESWDTAEPGKGYAEKAAQWRQKWNESVPHHESPPLGNSRIDPR